MPMNIKRVAHAFLLNCFLLGNCISNGQEGISSSNEDSPICSGEVSPPSCSCGFTCNAPFANFIGFQKCLKEKFPDKADKQLFLQESNQKDWDRAREQYYNPYKMPAAVVYAESAENVSNAVKCAFHNGYKVSVRGRGHSFQAMGVIDGALTIDMSRMCVPDKFVVDKTASGEHINDTKYIATIKAGAGCTNAIMLHSVNTHFKANEGAMALIGGCTSVGIAGYTLGGGMGDVTPYTGYAADLLQEIEMVMYDGRVINASRDENEDLFWASRGGGGGNGVVTSLTLRVVAAPGPKFTRVDMYYTNGREAILRFQKYLYDSNGKSAKFGGNVFSSDGGRRFNIKGVYLGNSEDLIDEMKNAKLFDDDLPFDDRVQSGLWLHFDKTGPYDNVGIPQHGVEIRQYSSYGDIEGRAVCETTLEFPEWTMRTDDICSDLGIDRDRYCRKTREIYELDCDKSVVIKERYELDCDNRGVIDALLEASGKPDSFINNHGPPHLNFGVPNPQLKGLFGLLLPPLEDKTIQDLTDFDVQYYHLGHGNPQTVDTSQTAFPWRNAGLLTANITNAAVEVLLKDKAFGGDRNKLQGYYNYMSPEIPNWRRFYFNQNWERLVEVKGKYDPYNVFGKPVTAETPSTPKSDGVISVK